MRTATSTSGARTRKTSGDPPQEDPAEEGGRGPESRGRSSPSSRRSRRADDLHEPGGVQERLRDELPPRRPAGTDVVIDNSYGTVTASGVRKARSTIRTGGSTLRTSTGTSPSRTATRTSTSTASGPPAGSRPNTPTSASARRGARSGSITAMGRSIEDAAADATITGEHREVSGQRIKGAWTSGRATRRSPARRGPGTVVGHHSAVEAEGVAGTLKVATTYENVRATTSGAI